MMEKIWKDIYGFEGLYQVSDMGEIYSCAKTIQGGNGGSRSHDGMILQADSSGEYLRVTLFKDKKRHKFLVHRIVAKHFHENPENKKFVNHINGNKLDNRAVNVEWSTQSENEKHAYRIGLKVPTMNRLGSTNDLNARSKKVMQLALDGSLIKIWPSVNEVQRKLGFRQGNISSCARNEMQTAYGFKWQY